MRRLESCFVLVYDAFEWDTTKATGRRHFETAVEIFRDPFGSERRDDREHYYEDCYILIDAAKGAKGTILTVVYSERSHLHHLGKTSNSAEATSGRIRARSASVAPTTPNWRVLMDRPRH